MISLNDGKWIQEPKFSPDGSKVAFIAENNLYYQDLNSGKITQITNDGKKNEIINGLEIGYMKRNSDIRITTSGIKQEMLSYL